MKKWMILLLALPFFMASCSDDENGFDPGELSYDGRNEAAPVLDIGTFQAAARFPSSITSQYNNQRLTEVEFYLDNVPESCRVLVYGQGTTNEPGDLLYSADVSSVVRSGRWNSHSLSNPLLINGQDIWITIEVRHDSIYSSIGCDPGPANNNGDKFYDDFLAEWETFRSWTQGGVSINWNIRGFVRE